MAFRVGEKVYIRADDWQVGTIIDRVADFIYSVELTKRGSSWTQEFTEDELGVYISPIDYAVLIKRNKAILDTFCQHINIKMDTTTNNILTICSDCGKSITTEELRKLKVETVIINELVYYKENYNES